MKFKFDGSLYRLKIDFIPADRSVGGLRETCAILSRYDKNLDAEVTIITGAAYCSTKDRFVKERGRKLAIARMFEEWKLSWYNSPSKELRKVFWRWYLCYPTFKNGNSILDLDIYND